jgi:hypothetical protein
MLVNNVLFRDENFYACTVTYKLFSRRFVLGLLTKLASQGRFSVEF